MRKPKRKHYNKNNTPIARKKIPGLEEAQNMAEKPLKELLFHPLMYKSSSGERAIDFEHIVVPFYIKGNLVFMLMFMDGCGSTSAYVECYDTDPEKPSETYKDAIPLMHECLEIEQHIGVEYYFGKLDKSLERYLYGMQLCINKEFLSKEQALEMIKELGMTDDDMAIASQSVADAIEESFQKEARMRREASVRSSVNDMILEFLMSITENKKEDEAPAGEEE